MSDRQRVPVSGSWWRARAACQAAPLEMVDEAFRRPGGEVAQEFKRGFCRRCPVAEPCLAEALSTGEAGIWGGTSPKVRTSEGSRHWLKARPSADRVAR